MQKLQHRDKLACALETLTKNDAKVMQFSHDMKSNKFKYLVVVSFLQLKIGPELKVYLNCWPVCVTSISQGFLTPVMPHPF